MVSMMNDASILQKTLLLESIGNDSHRNAPLLAAGLFTIESIFITENYLLFLFVLVFGGV